MNDPAPATTPPARRPGVFRWWGALLVIGLPVLAIAAAPLWIDGFVRRRIDNALLGQGWELAPGSSLSVSVFGGRLSSDGLRLREVRQGREMLSLTRLDLDVAVIDSLSAGDLIIESLTVEGVRGTLRRGPDGRIPWQRSEGSGDSSMNWAEYWRSAVERGKRWLEERQARKPGSDEPGERTETPKRPAAETDRSWEQARRYQPAPVPPTPERPLPRVVVRHLSISGLGVELPDQTPFDVISFRCSGSQVCDRLQPGEAMVLEGTAATAGSGEARFALHRSGDGAGDFTLAAPAVPVQALAHPALGGEPVARYGATGTAAVDAVFAWTGWQLSRGDVTGVLSDLHMAPKASAGAQVARTAKLVNALKGRPVTWPMKVGGTLLAPKITDSGFDEAAKSLLGQDALVEAAKEEAQEQAGKQLDQQIQKQAEKDPRVKQGVDALKSLIGR